MADHGVRVVAGSRRPDGTYRKDMRVRAGYCPQEEQPVYVPRHVQERRSAPKCPGLPPEDSKPGTRGALSGMDAVEHTVSQVLDVPIQFLFPDPNAKTSKGKAAAKNAKRKAKRAAAAVAGNGDANVTEVGGASVAAATLALADIALIDGDGRPSPGS